MPHLPLQMGGRPSRLELSLDPYLLSIGVDPVAPVDFRAAHHIADQARKDEFNTFTQETRVRNVPVLNDTYAPSIKAAIPRTTFSYMDLGHSFGAGESHVTIDLRDRDRPGRVISLEEGHAGDERVFRVRDNRENEMRKFLGGTSSAPMVSVEQVQDFLEAHIWSFDAVPLKAHTLETLCSALSRFGKGPNWIRQSYFMPLESGRTVFTESETTHLPGKLGAPVANICSTWISDILTDDRESLATTVRRVIARFNGQNYADPLNRMDVEIEMDGETANHVTHATRAKLTQLACRLNVRLLASKVFSDVLQEVSS